MPAPSSVSNGETCGLDQSCSLETAFVVVPAPTVSGIQPSEIQQPSLTQGVKIETIDIFGTNFTPGTTVLVGFGDDSKASGITVNNTIVIDSGHLKAEIVINANTSAGRVHGLRHDAGAAPSAPMARRPPARSRSS